MKPCKITLGDIADYDNLYFAYQSAIKGKRYRDDVLKFSQALGENLIVLLNEIEHEIYQVGPYSVFYVTKPKKRMIMALQFRDRVVQWAIYRQIFPLFDRGFIFDSYACRKDKGAHAAIDRLQYWMRQCDRKPGKWYSLKMDISKFFYRVNHEIMLEILGRKIGDPKLMRLLATIINSETQYFGLPAGMSPEEVPPEQRLADVGIPIGNLTSQMFANIYLDRLDQHAKHVLGVRHYIRYMDDVIILGPDKKALAQLWADIEAFLADRLDLQLNHKTSIQPLSQGVEFVGMRVWPTHRKLRRSTAKGIKRHLADLLERYKAGAVSAETLGRAIDSYKGVLKHCNSYGLRKKLNQIYARLMAPVGAKTDGKEEHHGNLETR